MGLFAAVRIARTALVRNRVRTALTTLGIVIGIAAVICTVALGEGSAALVEQQIASLGDSVIWIQPGSVRTAGARQGYGNARTLTAADGAAIQAQVPQVAACSPQVSGRSQIVAGDQNWNTRYTGIAPAYLSIRHWAIADGSGFDAIDVAQAAKVLVLGSNVATSLFGDARAVGQTVRMGPFPFRIVGVLASRGATGFGSNQDDQVFLPYTTAQKKVSGKTWIDNLMCSMASTQAIPDVEAAATTVLRARHRLEDGEPDDFNIRSPEEQRQLRVQTAHTLSQTLTGVAAISLVVGGVGIMNIMLVSVTERTREIGLRMAVGARDRDITRQFLVEAALLGLIGGVGGVLLGVGGAQLMTAAFGWPTLLTVNSMILATACATGAALVFGYYPALKASVLDPIEALKIES